MEAGDIFHMGTGFQGPAHPFHPPLPPRLVSPPRQNPESKPPSQVAHTLTACCRCRQRKTRCDPNLPRCLPCERSNSICEYYDTTKGKKISRYYVINLREEVRQLEEELSKYTDYDENEYPSALEDMVRPGGMVRLNETDETPRYLGPSSGITMTRLVMEEAKKYTESKRIADLIPQVRERRLDRVNRMQSVVTMGGSISGPSGRKKSYPMVSAYAAPTLPSMQVAQKLVELYNERAQIFTPILHETTFAQDLNAVFEGDKDPYKNFVVRMVFAMSLQKIATHYAGLADSYYLAAMKHLEEVIKPKDLRTLQCLLLMGQYSLLAPTRTAVYYAIGLATTICQQLGLGEEKTIALNISDPLTLDMRRRLGWIVYINELGLAQVMGRHNGFAKTDDLMDVGFFATVDDDHITHDGILPGPVSEKKAIAIHFCKLRMLQAEIRRALYENRKPTPKQDNDPWFVQIKTKIDQWRESAPEKPEWCRPWFTSRYHTMMVSLYRPSPQISKPTANAALICFDSASFIINISSEQVKKSAVDVTWVFLLTVYMSLNTLLWSLSYPEVRAKHPREEVEEFVNIAVELIHQCSERWPASEAAAQLYSVFAKACMQSYEVKQESPVLHNPFDTPHALGDASSPESAISLHSAHRGHAAQHQQQEDEMGLFNTTSVFGYVFNPPAEYSSAIDPTTLSAPSFGNNPTFRSNSIFLAPATDANGRRLSHFPPDFHSGERQMQDGMDDLTPPATAVSHNGVSPPPSLSNGNHNTHASPSMTPGINALPTPPESLGPSSVHHNGNPSLSPPLPGKLGRQTASPTPTPTMRNVSPAPMLMHPSPVSVPDMKYEQHTPTPPNLKYEPAEYVSGPAAQAPIKQQPIMPPPPRIQQRPLPTVTDWFNPPPPFISPHSFTGGLAPSYWADGQMPSPFAGLGLSGLNESYTIGGGGGGSGGRPTGGPGGNNIHGLPNGGGAFGGGPFNGNGFGHHFGGGGGPGSATYSFHPGQMERHGSLSQEQQMELMDVLETEGMSDIDALMNFNNQGNGAGGNNGADVRW